MTRRLAIGLLVGLGVVAALFVAGLGFLVSNVMSLQDVPDVSELDPTLATFQFDTLDGSRLGPPDLLGDVVVIDVWASWCGPCDVQARILEPLHEELGEDGVTVLALNTGEDVDTVQKHVDEKPFGYPVLLDPERKMMETAEISAIPTLFILNPLGELSYVSIGVTGRTALRKAIEEARAVESS